VLEIVHRKILEINFKHLCSKS